MPRTRVYEDNAARQRAYRRRKKDKKPGGGQPAQDPGAGAPPSETTVERATKAGNDALAQFFGKTKGS